MVRRIEHIETRKGIRPRRARKMIDYFIFKFYIPEYSIQSRPIPVRARQGFVRALDKAGNIFLIRGLKPIGEIHPSHLKLFDDGKVTYDVRRRNITPEHASWMRRNIGGKAAKKVGWERSY